MISLFQKFFYRTGIRKTQTSNWGWMYGRD